MSLAYVVVNAIDWNINRRRERNRESERENERQRGAAGKLASGPHTRICCLFLCFDNKFVKLVRNYNSNNNHSGNKKQRAQQFV